MKNFRKQRNIRKYKDQPIEQDVLNAIIENALIAPSSKDRNSCEFIVVTDKNLLNELSKARKHGSDFLKDAPIAIVVLSESEKSSAWIEDLSVAAFTIQLSAFNAGLATCWVQVRDRDRNVNESTEDSVKATLNIPDNYEVECIISMGYSDEETDDAQIDERCFERVYCNTFGNK